MELDRRKPSSSLPSFALTSDILSFLRCGLQYRFYQVGQLPQTRPYQQWFGRFIHGVLEEGFRAYHAQEEASISRADDNSDQCGGPPEPTLVPSDVDRILRDVKERLAAEGLRIWEPGVEQAAFVRARILLNELTPLVFPIMHRAEVRLRGARVFPSHLLHDSDQVYDRYEIAGVVDVITQVRLKAPSVQGNILVDLVIESLKGQPPDDFELVLDYKGMRRPSRKSSSNDSDKTSDHEWQVMTYAFLRQQQKDALPVAAGVVVYLNELQPTVNDMTQLQIEIEAGLGDVIPDAESPEYEAIRNWNPSCPVPTLPLPFRLKRAIRVIPVSPSQIESALLQFDEVVARIEQCRIDERRTGQIIESWETNVDDRGTCDICDLRAFCPSFSKAFLNGVNAVLELPRRANP